MKTGHSRMGNGISSAICKKSVQRSTYTSDRVSLAQVPLSTLLSAWHWHSLTVVSGFGHMMQSLILRQAFDWAQVDIIEKDPLTPPHRTRKAIVIRLHNLDMSEESISRWSGWHMQSANKGIHMLSYWNVNIVSLSVPAWWSSKLQ